MAATPVTEIPVGDWTVVRRRRRSNRRHPIIPQLHTLTPSPSPSPWAPPDPTTADPFLVSRLISRIHTATSRLESSKFFTTFLSHLTGPHSQPHISQLAHSSNLQLVLYGIGSFDFSLPSRLQLALALLLRRHVAHLSAVEIFDPVLSATECAAAGALGLAVLRFDERCRRKAVGPTLFYMPHCEVGLYDALLSANWRPELLRNVVVLGNSFGKYWEKAKEPGNVAKNAKYVLEVVEKGFVKEVEIEEDEEEEGVFRAFNGTSWHFFVDAGNAKLDDF